MLGAWSGAIDNEKEIKKLSSWKNVYRTFNVFEYILSINMHINV